MNVEYWGWLGYGPWPGPGTRPGAWQYLDFLNQVQSISSSVLKTIVSFFRYQRECQGQNEEQPDLHCNK